MYFRLGEGTHLARFDRQAQYSPQGKLTAQSQHLGRSHESVLVLHRGLPGWVQQGHDLPHGHP